MVKVTRLSNKTYEETSEFYRSHEWRSCRREFLKNNLSRECSYCKIELNEEIEDRKLNVDHIKPLKYYWDLRIDHSNLQIVCHACNKMKGSFKNPEQGQKNWWALNYGSSKYENKRGYYKWLYKKKI
jgi:5-methylcytosine-specific restriction endonuclease McrA